MNCERCTIDVDCTAKDGMIPLIRDESPRCSSWPKEKTETFDLGVLSLQGSGFRLAIVSFFLRGCDTFDGYLWGIEPHVAIFICNVGIVKDSPQECNVSCTALCANTELSPENGYGQDQPTFKWPKDFPESLLKEHWLGCSFRHNSGTTIDRRLYGLLPLLKPLS